MLQTDTLVIGLYKGGKMVDRLIVGPDADNNRVDTTGYALRLIDADEDAGAVIRTRGGARELVR